MGGCFLSNKLLAPCSETLNTFDRFMSWVCTLGQCTESRKQMSRPSHQPGFILNLIGIRKNLEKCVRIRFYSQHKHLSIKLDILSKWKIYILNENVYVHTQHF